VVKLRKLRNAATECRMSAIYASIQVAHAHARACEPALPAGLDAKPLQTPGKIKTAIRSVHFGTK
jgi:hypothetical protein